ncbi:hypothetical protein [Paraburkholderia strydomiana]|uniref:hypothetical protein n=1 Tax=Paraburkholderia strydomiana TaxID=1245417 RepID=UPI00203614C2|nr:hypothetical protein [Paraburkholderia strydomiana]
MQQVPVVLAPQDTTEFNLMHLPATQGLGHGTSSNLHGFMLHSLLAVAPEGLPLGVLGMKTWIRAREESIWRIEATQETPYRGEGKRQVARRS